MKHDNAVRLLSALALLAVAGGSAHAGTSCAPNVAIASNFTTGAQGWTSNTPAEVAWQSTGGSPGGFIQFTDQTGNSTYIDAPASYHAAYTKLNNAGYITYQHAIIAETGVTSYSPYEIRLSGPGGAAKFDGSPPTATSTGWVTVVAPLVSADWTVTSGTWTGLLASVTDLQIDIELVTNATIPGDTDIEGIDNVAIVSVPCGFYSPPS
jgi:hypothetical protein